MFKIVAGLPQTKGSTKLKSSKGATLRRTLLPCMLRAVPKQQYLLTAHRLCRAERVSDMVQSFCFLKGVPQKATSRWAWALKEQCNVHILSLRCCSLGVLWQRDRFPMRLAFYTRLFPPFTCTWSAVIGWIPSKWHLADDFAIEVQEGHGWQYESRVSPPRR